MEIFDFQYEHGRLPTEPERKEALIKRWNKINGYSNGSNPPQEKNQNNPYNNTHENQKEPNKEDSNNQHDNSGEEQDNDGISIDSESVHSSSTYTGHSDSTDPNSFKIKLTSFPFLMVCLVIT